MPEIIRKAYSVLTRRERLGAIPLVLLMVVSALMESFGVSLVVPLISGIMDPSRLEGGAMGRLLSALFGSRSGESYLSTILVVMIVLFLVKNAFIIWRSYIQNLALSKVRVRIQSRMLHYYLSRPYSFFLDAESGRVLRSVTSDSDNSFMLLDHILNFFSCLIISAIMAVAVFLIHPRIALFLTVVLIVEYSVILRFIRPFLQRQGQIYRESHGVANGIVLQMMRGIKSVKVGDSEPYFEKGYDKQVRHMAHAHLIEQSFSGVPQRMVEALTVSALLVYILILLVQGNDVSGLVPILSAFVLAASRMLPNVGSMSSSASYANYYKESLDHVAELMDTLDHEEVAEAENPVVSNVPASFERDIRLEDISFTYPGGDEPVLEHASLVIPCNKSVGIVGESGAGKTTLVDVLLGLLVAQCGEIRMDGSVVDPSSREWHAKFAYIPQNVFMLSGTIRDNVVFGQDELSEDDKRVWEALEMAQLFDFVRSLKDGLDAEIGEAGIRLSGGQAQRLGIARALYANAPVLVLDEATSALDNETEAALMDAISTIQGTKTLVIIAHRLTTIENCDIVYRVEGGTVTEDGR